MEQTDETLHPEEGYVPRPKWQVWAARLGLVIFIALVIAQIINLARGNLL